MQHHTPHTWWVHLTSGQNGQIAVGEKGKQLAELAPCTSAACDCSQLAATSCREHVPKVAELWDNFKLFISNLNLWNFSFIDSLSSPKAAGPLMLLLFLCTQRLQPPQKIALELPTPDWQTPQGYFPDFFSTSRLMPDSIIFVFPMFTRRPFFSISVFHVCTFTSSSSMDSALIIRPSAYSSSYGQPVRNSLDRASNTMMKSSGVRTEPWWTPTPTPNSSLYPSPTLTLLLTSLYMDWTRRTSHSSIPSLRIAH